MQAELYRELGPFIRDPKNCKPNALKTDSIHRLLAKAEGVDLDGGVVIKSMQNFAPAGDAKTIERLLNRLPRGYTTAVCSILITLLVSQHRLREAESYLPRMLDENIDLDCSHEHSPNKTYQTVQTKHFPTNN